MDPEAAELRAFYRRAVRLAQLLIIVGSVTLYLAMANGRAAALGLIVGGSVGILRYCLRLRALLRLGSAGPLVRSRLVGYGLNAAALGAAFGFPETIWPWSTVAGLLLMNASLIATELRRRDDAAPAPTASPD